MKLVAVMLPADVAVYLDAVQAQLARLEELPPDVLAESLAKTRAWLSESAASLRKADTRGKAEARPMAVQAPRQGGEEILRKISLEKGQAKKPCDCEEKKIVPPVVEDPLSWRELGMLVGRRILGR